jgi:hypothetical protein
LANSGEGLAKIDHYAYKPILTCKKTKTNWYLYWLIISTSWYQVGSRKFEYF